MTPGERHAGGAAGSGPCESLLSAEDNRRMFDRIARRYDLMNRVLSLGLDRRWRRRAVAAMSPREGGRYLDVGCGTGDMALEVLRQAPGAEVLGVDPAEEMLRIAVQRIAKAGLSERIHFQAGDGMALPAEDRAFAGAVTAFCLRNITHRAAALAEMRRVLEPGAKAVILELTVPEGRFVRMGHWLYTRGVVPLAGRIIARSADAYRYLVDSVQDFPQPAEVLSTMEAAGFEEVRHERLHGGTVTVFVGRAP